MPWKVVYYYKYFRILVQHWICEWLHSKLVSCVLSSCKHMCYVRSSCSRARQLVQREHLTCQGALYQGCVRGCVTARWTTARSSPEHRQFTGLKLTANGHWKSARSRVRELFTWNAYTGDKMSTSIWVLVCGWCEHRIVCVCDQWPLFMACCVRRGGQTLKHLEC